MSGRSQRAPVSVAEEQNIEGSSRGSGGGSARRSDQTSAIEGTAPTAGRRSESPDEPNKGESSYERRRDQVRRAQRLHRQRKEQYVKDLEREVEELRELYHPRITALESENAFLRSVVTAYGIHLPPRSAIETPVSGQRTSVMQPGSSMMQQRASSVDQVKPSLQQVAGSIRSTPSIPQGINPGHQQEVSQLQHQRTRSIQMQRGDPNLSHSTPGVSTRHLSAPPGQSPYANLEFGAYQTPTNIIPSTIPQNYQLSAASMQQLGGAASNLDLLQGQSSMEASNQMTMPTTSMPSQAASLSSSGHAGYIARPASQPEGSAYREDQSWQLGPY